MHFGESGASLVFRNDSFVLVWWDYLDFGVILAAYPLCGSWWGVKIIWYEMSLRKDAFQWNPFVYCLLFFKSFFPHFWFGRCMVQMLLRRLVSLFGILQGRRFLLSTNLGEEGRSLLTDVACVSKSSQVNHVPIHCDYTYFCCVLFAIFGVAWVLTHSIMDMLISWHSRLCPHLSGLRVIVVYFLHAKVKSSFDLTYD